MKIILKLSWNELKDWGWVIERTFNSLHYAGKGHQAMMIGLLMSKLNETLRMKWAKVKEINKVEIPAEQGLAFILHLNNLPQMIWGNETRMAIDKIVGIIDQKTK